MDQMDGLDLRNGGGKMRKTTATGWKINMEPKNRGLEDDFHFQQGDF